MKLLLTGFALYCFLTVSGQTNFKAVVMSGENVLPAATILWKEGGRTFVADSAGMIVITGIPVGKQHFRISFAGMAPMAVSYIFPLASDSSIMIFLEEVEDEEEEVIVTATRTSRTIANTPTRTVVISGEELDEKANMKPGDIRMLLNETTGVQTQQTSATSYNSSIRIQGLDGRYTQVLKDGFPLYAGFSGGLSLMQVVPLDLRQVEVIKGSASTLYGGGAIAGLVNLVSKVPGEEREISFFTNVTSAKGIDLSGYYSQKFKGVGLSLFSSANAGQPYDPADIGLTAIPKFRRYSINPRLFLYGKKTNADFGVSYMSEDRTGGSIEYIRHGTTGYFEENTTRRFNAQAKITHTLSERSSLQFKNSYNRYKRGIFIPSYGFGGKQQSYFSELTYHNHDDENSQWIVGMNLLTDQFREDNQPGIQKRDYKHTTIGAFVQHTWSPSEMVTLESGLRADRVNEYGFEWLPRIAALFKFTPSLTARIGGGIGYKTPTVFNEEAERIQFQLVRPINSATTQNERSIGGNIDVNYRTMIGPVSFSLNQLFFYTRLNDPLVLTLSSTSTGYLDFENANGHIDTRGLETNLKFVYSNFKLFVGYTYADVNTHFDGILSWLPLTSRHRLNNVLMYEVEEKWKLGLEAYYFSEQKLSDNTRGKPYWIFGFMVERLWEKFSVFINFENFTDSRQTKFDTIYTGSIDNPVFRDIYAPVDGFVVNGGVKLKL
ncbi:MAG: TonB-dependent receptor [Chitinophagaceae bacterium]|nr:TonB-dependent receptor [Chitinophagaceae bacterium]